MGWEPTVQRIVRKNRKTYYRLRVDNRDHHLGTDPAEAYKRAAEILVAYESGGGVSGAPGTIAELILRYAESSRAVNTNYPREMLKPWAEWAGAMRLSEISTEHFEQFVEWLRTKNVKQGNHKKGWTKKLSPWSIQKFVRYALRAARWAAKKGWVTAEIATPKLPKAVKKPRDIASDTLAKVFATLPTSPRNILKFMVETGCRPSEAVRLTWDEVDLARGVCVLKTHKTEHHGRARTIYLTPEATRLLQSIENRKGVVFRNSNCEQYTVGGLRAILRRRGITGIYQLRHTFAQNALEQGVPLEDVAKLLGHSGLSQVQTYAQIRDARALAVASTIKPLTTEPKKKPPG